MSLTENVLVVKRANLLRCHIQSGLTTQNISQIYDFILAHHEFIVRGDAEQDETYKQVIPYIVIRKEDEMLLFKRKNKQTETRLHDKYSLGVGGHINENTSDNGLDVIMNGLFKELNEEVALTDASLPHFVGVIHDESTEVGKYHLGLLFEITTTSSAFELLEPHKMSAEWVPLHDLLYHYDAMETWSQIVFKKYL